MKNVHLFTDNEAIFREALSGLPCIIIFHDYAGLSNISEFMHNDIIVYHISNSFLDSVKQCITSNPTCIHVCATEEITEKQKFFFLQNGIAYVIQTINPGNIASCIHTLLTGNENNLGKMLIYDDIENHIGILSSITEHFGCKPVFVNNTDDFFNKLTSEDFHFVLVNIGSTKLDINVFVNKCHAHTAIKKNPLIAYKDTANRLSINELMSGLNRYASYILSPEELYSFLINIFFRKELMPLIENLNSEVLFNRFANYSRDSFSQIYYKTKDNILNIPNILNTEKLLSTTDVLEKINKSIIGASVLNWMHVESPEVKTIIDENAYNSNMHMNFQATR